ncbi:unnamed protein product, partial [marine sediment metagenome]
GDTGEEYRLDTGWTQAENRPKTVADREQTGAWRGPGRR